MEYFVVGLVAFVASVLTFFSGFGLGTLLLPAFLFFYSPELAVALTALVHLGNNLFKGALLFRHALWSIVVRFGLPALAASFLGALVQVHLGDVPSLASYWLFGTEMYITVLGLFVSMLMLVMAFVDVIPALGERIGSNLSLVAGGLASGFIGGVSGHQGALRSMVLVRLSLDKRAFLGTGVVIAILVDFSRLAVYSRHIGPTVFTEQAMGTIVALSAAALGVLVGNKLSNAVTLQVIRTIVFVFVVATAVLLGAGIIGVK